MFMLIELFILFREGFWKKYLVHDLYLSNLSSSLFYLRL